MLILLSRMRGSPTKGALVKKTVSDERNNQSQAKPNHSRRWIFEMCHLQCTEDGRYRQYRAHVNNQHPYIENSRKDA